MAAKIGYVDNTLATGPNTLAHHNMLDLIRRFCSGDGSHGAITQTGTGNGKLTNFRALSDAVAETWTITCTAAAANSGTFSVVGSVSGAQAAATVGVDYKVPGKVAFKIIDGTVDFAVGAQFQVTVAPNAGNSIPVKSSFFGTGNGTLTGFHAYEGGQSEVWTIKLITPAANGGTFSVEGSRSGPQANAVVGTPYDNGLIRFTINDGSIDFVADDTFTYIPGIWKVLRWDDGAGVQANGRELIMVGSGHTGHEEVYIGFRTYHSVASDYYNMSVSGFIGYVPGNSFITQPGYFEVGLPTHNQRIDYWLCANPQRVVAALKVGTPVYVHFYTGFFLPYATPSQYPYPIFVGAQFQSAQPATRYSDTAHTFPYTGYINSSTKNLSYRFVNGAWQVPYVYPFSSPSSYDAYASRNDTLGVYSVEPLILNDSLNVFGELEGVHAITGFNNVVENTTTIDGVDYVVIQDSYRTSFNDYIALELR